jgi:UDP-N-acetylglucosamine 4-epimerase
VFGPRQSPGGPYAAAIPLFAHALLTGKKVAIHGDGEQTRDFTYVDNAVMANIHALFTDLPENHNIFNIAAGHRTSINQVFHMLQKLCDSKAEPAYLPSRAGDIRDSLADIAHAQEKIGYAPTVMVEEGLAQTIEWMKGKH